MRYHVKALALVAAGAATLVLGGCATEAYVDEHVGAVNARVDQLSGRVDGLAGQVSALSGRVDANDAAARAAQARADEAYAAAQGKLVLGVVFQDEVTFDTNRWTLTPEAEAKLTQIADKIKAEGKYVFIQLVGHADRRGPELRNRILGEKRAIEVRHFLYDQGIPLRSVETVSWGETKPTAGGAADLASNRRVEIIVLQ